MTMTLLRIRPTRSLVIGLQSFEVTAIVMERSMWKSTTTSATTLRICR